jgi:hypothetical protein
MIWSDDGTQREDNWLQCESRLPSKARNLDPTSSLISDRERQCQKQAPPNDSTDPGIRKGINKKQDIKAPDSIIRSWQPGANSTLLRPEDRKHPEAIFVTDARMQITAHQAVRKQLDSQFRIGKTGLKFNM